MIKKTIMYEDLEGNMVERELYFHLSIRELGAINEKYGNLSNIANLQPIEIFNTMNDIILTAYGERSIDGDRLEKSQQIREKFEQSLAYDTFLTDLLEDKRRMVEFVKGIIPNKVAKMINVEKPIPLTSVYDAEMDDLIEKRVNTIIGKRFNN